MLLESLNIPLNSPTPDLHTGVVLGRVFHLFAHILKTSNNLHHKLLTFHALKTPTHFLVYYAMKTGVISV